jgi:cytochrome P450
MFAGHETTANTLCWTLLELARHPEVQSRLRTEIRAAEREARSRGVSELSTTELDNMPFTLAVIKVCIITPRIVFSLISVQEGLRYHPVAYNNYREAIKDDVLPLSRPIMTTSGDTIHELLIPKGTKIITSIAAYNR